MNKAITLVVFLCISFITYGQEDSFSAKTKGTYFANGSLNVFSTTRKINDNKADAFTIEFTPRGGYFIIDNLAVGLGIVLSRNKETTDAGFGDIETTVTGFGITPLARYYFENNIFGEAAIGFGSTKSEIETGGFEGSEEFKSNTFGFRIGAGYALFLGKHIAIEPSLNYSWEDVNPEDAPSDYDESLSSIFLNIGITAFF